MDLLTVSGVSRKEKNVFTVSDVSFSQQRLQKIAIAGETGSGKTTLLKLIGGLVQPDEGQIWFQQKKVRGPNDQLIPGHTGIAYLSQQYELRNNYTVSEILSYANELTQSVADTLYSVCRIDHLLDRRTDQLSGGEKQRIALARLLIGAPSLLLLDEPFSNLDGVHKAIIKKVIADINDKLQISCIMVSHDPADILPWADTILVMQQGRVTQQDTAEKVYQRPVNAYCAGLFGMYNLLGEELVAQLQPGNAVLPRGKKLMVRPEQIIVATTGTGVIGIIQTIAFMGSYYVLEIDVAGTCIKASTNNASFTCGQTVQVSLYSFESCFI